MMTRRRGEAMEATSSGTFWLETYREHGSAILAFLTSRVGRRDVAEDLLQETFVRAMRRLGQPDADGNIRSYLFTTAHRLILDRRRRATPALFSEMGRVDEPAFEERRAADLRPADELVDLRTIRELVDDELAGLTDDQRVAFESAVLGGRSYPVVAREQGWTVAKVKIDVFRARKRVMQRLRERLLPDLETVS